MRRTLVAGGVAWAFLAALASACGSGSQEGEGVTPSGDAPPPGADPGKPSPSDRDGSTTDPSRDGGDPSDPNAEPSPVPYVAFDVNHVLSTGQSNAVANDGVPVLSTSQPYGNLMFDVGVMTSSSCGGDGCTRYDVPNALVPLREGDTFFYPVETMSSGFANLASAIAQGKGLAKHDILVSLHGRSGNSYWCLRKGGCGWWEGRGYVEPFEDGMKQIADGKRLASAAGKSYVVRGVTAIHGEHDHYAYSNGTPLFPLAGTDGTSTLHDYADGLIEWQRDYEEGAKAITGQKEPVPLFVSQYSHWNDTAHTVIAFMQLDAHVRAPGKVIVVTPTYMLPYTRTCLHFTNEGERHLGEYFAKAYARTIIDGRRWEPLRPVKITMAGNVVTAKFHVPTPPLVIDTTRVADPGNFGFEYFDGSAAPPAITNVEVTGPDTVKVTLAAAPTAPLAARRLRYAYTFNGCGESGTGATTARGNLRDSDATTSLNGYDLFNWAVHFDAPMTAP